MAYIRAPPCRGAHYARLHLLTAHHRLSHQHSRSRVRVTSEAKTATRDVPGLQTMPWTDSKEQKEVDPIEGWFRRPLVSFTWRYLTCVAQVPVQSAPSDDRDPAGITLLRNSDSIVSIEMALLCRPCRRCSSACKIVGQGCQMLPHSNGFYVTGEYDRGYSRQLLPIQIINIGHELVSIPLGH